VIWEVKPSPEGEGWMRGKYRIYFKIENQNIPHPTLSPRRGL